MIIECCLLHKISMGPIILIILLPSRLLIIILRISVTALLQMLLSPCYLLLLKYAQAFSVTYSFITPPYHLFISFITAFALSFSSDCLCLTSSGLLLFKLLGKTYQWTQGTLSATSCQFKNNYTFTNGPKNIQTLC